MYVCVCVLPYVYGIAGVRCLRRVLSNESQGLTHVSRGEGNARGAEWIIKTTLRLYLFAIFPTTHYGSLLALLPSCATYLSHPGGKSSAPTRGQQNFCTSGAGICPKSYSNTRTRQRCLQLQIVPNGPATDFSVGLLSETSCCCCASGSSGKSFTFYPMPGEGPPEDVREAIRWP